MDLTDYQACYYAHKLTRFGVILLVELPMPPELKRVPLPAAFPPGSTFWDLEGTGVARPSAAGPLGDGFLVTNGGGDAKFVPLEVALAGGAMSMPERLSRSGVETTESDFHAIAAS